MTPFKGSKLTTWEGGMRVPMVIRWPGHIKPGTLLDQIFASYDWLPTLVEIAGGPKGNDLNAQIMAGKYPGIVKTKLQGVNQLAYLTGASDTSARKCLPVLHGGDPFSGALQELEDLLHDGRFERRRRARRAPAFGWAQVQNIRRDVFEQAVGEDQKSVLSIGGALALAEHGLSLQLEHAPHRATVVAAGTRVLHRVPAAAGTGELQPYPGSAAGQGDGQEGHEPVTPGRDSSR